MFTRRLITVAVSFCLLFGLVGVAWAAPDTPAANYPGLWKWDGQTIESSASDVGSHTSIAFDPSTGIPYISYYDATAQTVKLASPLKDGNCGPNNSWWCRPIGDPQSKVGKYSSIDISRRSMGFWDLGIAYYNENNGGLRFAEYSCTVLACHWSYDDVYAPSSASIKYPSLKYGTDGTPYISFYASTGLDAGLFYAHRVASGGNCAGNTKWACDKVDSKPGLSVGMYNSLALNSSNEARISYYDAVGKYLKYAVQSTAGGDGVNCGPGGNTWVCRGIDPSGNDQGLFTSLALSPTGKENPHIAYYDKTSGMLKHAYYVGSDGNCGLNSSTLKFEWQCDNMINIGAGMGALGNVGITIALDANQSPVIGYMNASEDLAPSALEIARPNSAYHRFAGNCGPTIGNPIHISQWTCQTLDNGGAYTSEAAYASLGISPAGLAYVAYSEWDDYHSKNNLKIAFQQFQNFIPLVAR